MLDDTAGVVFSFNRPDYLKQVLESLAEAQGSGDVTWYGYQDGPVNQISGNRYTDDETIDECVELMENGPLNFEEININEYNRCIAHQKHCAQALFDSYERVFFFESDLMIGKHYLRLLNVALDQFPDYAILMNRCPNKNKKLDKLQKCGSARIWGYGMNASLFEKWRNYYFQFWKGIKEIDYLLRHQGSNMVVLKNGMKVVSHDVTISKLCRRYGSGKLWPMVSRGFYIGKDGNIAFRSKKAWRKRNLGDQCETITYEEDENRNEFKLG